VSFVGFNERLVEADERLERFDEPLKGSMRGSSSLTSLSKG